MDDAVSIHPAVLQEPEPPTSSESRPRGVHSASAKAHGSYERSVSTQVYAYIQPNGSWCWSNAGVVTNRQTRESVLVDTLTDERLTADMLRHMAPVLDHSPLKLLVHTHGDLDHVLGNALVADNVSQVRPREFCPDRGSSRVSGCRTAADRPQPSPGPVRNRPFSR